jgi:flagellar motor switch protein FliN/FliY
MTAPTQAPNDQVPLAALLDLSLSVSIELGRTRMSVQDLLKLGRGSVIRLARLAGEPIDIYVADKHFAEGEVLVVNEHFGVRITRIIAPVTGGEASA